MNNFDMKKIITPILLHLLKQEFLFPHFFILKCILTCGRFKRNIDKRFPEELIELIALPLWVYANLKNKIGQRKAFEVMRVAILIAGVAKQNLLFDTVNKAREFQNFIEQELEINKTGTTKWNTLEIVERSECRFEIKITKCLFHELAVSLNMPEITPIICQIDNAVFNSYLPEAMVFHRGGMNRRIADGSPECHFVWELLG